MFRAISHNVLKNNKKKRNKKMINVFFETNKDVLVNDTMNHGINSTVLCTYYGTVLSHTATCSHLKYKCISDVPGSHCQLYVNGGTFSITVLQNATFDCNLKNSDCSWVCQGTRNTPTQSCVKYTVLFLFFFLFCFVCEF